MSGKKAKPKRADDAPLLTEIILKKLLKYYDNYSTAMGVKTCPDVIKAIRSCLENGKELKKIIVRPIDKDFKAEEKFKKALSEAKEQNDTNKIAELKANYSNMPPPIALEPLMKALNDVQLSTCKELYIIDLPLNYVDAIQLTNFLKLGNNSVSKIVISDCLLDLDCVKKISTSLNSRIMLSSLCLDYNEFGDKGCHEVCKGLIGNRHLVMLSLNFCNLTYKSGEYLGDILATTAVKDIYLDGNNLRCHGAISLISKIVEECENEVIRKELEEKARLEEEERRLEEEAAKPSWERIPVEENPTDPENEGKKPKKKKKKKKKKKSSEPPKVGPFVCKLHLADNGIDIYEDGADVQKSLKIIRNFVEMITKLIKLSSDIQEIDLHNNTIGNMSAKMILNALEYRKINKIGNLAVRVSEKIDKELFNSIIKASKKIKKKKGKKKKKKS
ncbi:LRR and PYD domains-containing 5 [Brachionus plicatilis]|uniref:LRR and PYD domains-containing 5 n=1 Tax=Brachionus plicatilis TaxID=10195 RepID=A0A3M7RUR5_BRAPC|nr:LRR and PYD domains-containing 5 [Brachionus plicatilis]